MKPGETKELVLKIPPEARYLGAVAAYRNLNSSKWKALSPAPESGLLDFVRKHKLIVKCRQVRSEDHAGKLKKGPMSSNNRVVWSEGLFLRPQHFQQQERHLERYIEGRSRDLRPTPGVSPSSSWSATCLRSASSGCAGPPACFPKGRRSRCPTTIHCPRRSS